jgi:hypothetical protein
MGNKIYKPTNSRGSTNTSRLSNNNNNNNKCPKAHNHIVQNQGQGENLKNRQGKTNSITLRMMGHFSSEISQANVSRMTLKYWGKILQR